MRKSICLPFALLMFFLFPEEVFTRELITFTSDGCSSFPDGTITQNQLWLNCCRAHDFAYWKGGTYQDRVDADMELRKCVAQVGEEKIALVMLAGVRAGGTPYLPTAFRWGYGWPYLRFYGPLSKEEQRQIKELSNKGGAGNKDLNE